MSGEVITRLLPPIDVQTPFGWAVALWTIHSGSENEPQICCSPYDGERAGDLIDIPQKDVKLGRNYSVRRITPNRPPKPPEFMLAKQAADAPSKKPARDRVSIGK